MALNGRLEDLNLLEILQIVAFSKKTGKLRAFESQFSLEDQGPLTQELTRIPGD